MIEISRAARYDAPAGTIFAIITDLASYPAWQPGVESAGLAGEGPARQGSRIRQVRMVMGRRTEIGLTITRLGPAELVTLATDPGGTPAVRETYRLRPDGDGCRWSSGSPSTASPRWPSTSPAPSSPARYSKCWNASPPSRPAVSRQPPAGVAAS
jgi:hypothetical protein